MPLLGLLYEQQVVGDPIPRPVLRNIRSRTPVLSVVKTDQPSVKVTATKPVAKVV